MTRASSSTPSATILVADSRPELRNLLTLILRRDGYEVLEASTAAEALQIASTHLDLVSLLVTSANLSDMNGEKLGLLLADLRPGLLTLCLSAYPQDYL